MALSNDLISQFVKATRDSSRNKRKEATVYGTTVALNGKMYVKIDGSDLMTPVVTTTDIKANQRVAVMIKDHFALVTGNVTSPSVGKDTTDDLSTQIGGLQGQMSDKITTDQLNAQVAVIEKLIANKAEIGELEALKAQIKDLDVENLSAHLAQIDKLIAGKADITDLDAVHARIDILQADVGNIQTLIGGNLTMDNIQSLVLTSSKVTVDNAFIKDAMIDRVSASKLTAGKINTGLVEIGSDDGSMTINGSLQQFRDKAGNVRIQIGKDSTGDFTFALYGADGKGQLINQNGIQASGIGDGLIVDSMVGDNANIAGSKLDIGSVVTEINGSTTTISSSKIQFDDKKQTLDVAFNNMQTEVNKIPELAGTTAELVNTTQTHTTAIKTQKGQIETLISDTTLITQDGQPIKMKDDYSQFKVTVGEFGNKIGSLETNFGKTLKMTKTEYYVSLSAISLVGGTWSEATPEWSKGKFIWQRLVYYYNDGTIVRGTEVCIQGAAGEDGRPGTDGTPGTDGVGISRIEEYYQVSNSDRTPPTSWVTSPPPMTTENPYLWNYEKMIFTNNTFKETEKRIIGVHGQNGTVGKDGVGIKFITNKYLATSQATGVTIDTPGWTTTVQSMSPIKKYLWAYETILYTDGKSTNTTPCIIGVYGDKGEAGIDGKGIAQITEYYQVSKFNQGPPDTWLTTPPPMTEIDKYLWNYERIEYTDGTHKETEKRIIGVHGQNGAQGTAGANGVGIGQVKNYYLLSNDSTGVTHSTPGWTEMVQNVSASKKYLWNYEQIIYTSGNSDKTNPCIIGTYGRDGVDGQDGKPGRDGVDGKPGVDGEPGRDGIGIAKIEEFYQVSTSDSIIPISWVTTPPKLTATNKYLWNYEKVTYTDNTAKETAKRVIGVYGDKGQDGETGNGLQSITNKYLVSPKATGVTIDTPGWTTDIPTLSNTNKYLWSYEIVFYTDGRSVNTTPCIIGVYGDKGEDGQDGTPGKDGQSVVNVIPQYCSHTSSTTKPLDDAQWVDTCPAYIRGRFLWIRNKIIFANPTETKYTYPYYEPSWDAKATAEEAKNTVTSKISEFNQTLDGFKTKVESTEAKVNNSKYGLINYVLKSDQTLEAVPIEATWSNDRLLFEPDKDFFTDSLGMECTYSVEVYTKDAVSIPEEGSKWCRLGGELAIHFEDGSTSYLGGAWKIADLSGTKQYTNGKERCYTTFTMPNKPIKNIEVRLLAQGLKSGTAKISRPLLTIGNIKSDYQVNIKDVMGHIDDAAKMTNGQGQVVYIKDQLTQTETTVNGIKNTVSSLESHFDDDGTVTQMSKQMTEFAQLANKFTMDFWTKFQESHDGVTQLHDYIHFTPDGITIGQENYPVKLMLTKDRIKFVNTDGAQLAYFSDGKLFVNDAEILATMKIANYAFLPTSGGSLTIAAIR